MYVRTLVRNYFKVGKWCNYYSINVSWVFTESFKIQIQNKADFGSSISSIIYLIQAPHFTSGERVGWREKGIKQDLVNEILDRDQEAPTALPEGQAPPTCSFNLLSNLRGAVTSAAAPVPTPHSWEGRRLRRGRWSWWRHQWPPGPMSAFYDWRSERPCNLTACSKSLGF